MYVRYIGELFLRMLKALILPLIIPSLISAIGSLDMSLSGKVGGRAVGYYMATTVLAVILGIILVNAIHPGRASEGASEEIQGTGESQNVTAVDTLLDLARNLLPPNLIQAGIQQYRTVLKYPGNVNLSESDGQVRVPDNLYTWKIGGEYTSGTNILGLVFFSVVLGITLAIMEEKGKPLIDFFTCLSEAMMTIKLLEEKNGVDPRIARFVLPIGATINMDGTALYEAIAAIFIAQVRQVPMSVGQIIAVSITATAASIGAAGIPQAGLVTMVMVLDTVGLPAEDVTIILAVDWLLDRFRTAINVLGDSIGAGIVYHLSKNELQAFENKPSVEQGGFEAVPMMEIEDNNGEAQK